MSDDRKLNKKRIAKNTALLYVRMIFVIVVGLYTSRVVINALGVSDYGVYNVVGGIVSMLAFLNTAMTAASQRFISYELGGGDKNKLNKVFCTSVNIHLLIALVIFVLAETIGLWFVNTELNIESDRITAANWVYQFSIVTFMLTVWSVPYNSCIVAHEHMNAFAYIGIVDVVLKLGIALLLSWSDFDKLILYALLIFVISLIIRLAYGLYCKIHFEECRYRFVWDKELFKKMFSFAGWSVLGNLGFSFKDSVSNIILNIFFGTTVNAARGIAMQVNGMIISFSHNFSMSLYPQITKQYAAGNVEASKSLVYAGARYSFYLMMIICIPFLINMDYVLGLWLGVVPEYTGIFLALTLMGSLIYALAGTLTTALQATGNIKVFQIGISIIMLAELPAAYVLLKMGYPPYSAMCPSLVTYTIAVFFRLYLLKHLVPVYDYKYYTIFVFLWPISIFVICYLLCHCMRCYFEDGFATTILTSSLSIIIILLVIYFIGITNIERLTVNKKILSYLKIKE